MQTILAENKKVKPVSFLLPLLMFIVLHIVLFFQTGIHTGLEADKYITEGNYLYDHGGFTASKYIFYLPVILLVYACRFLHISVVWVAAVQILLSAFALRCFYRLAEKLGGAVIAVWSASLLAVFIPFQLWNLFLYTDSVFISLTLIYAWVIFSQGDKGIKGTVYILCFLLLLLFSRPHGLLIVPPTILFLIFRSQSRKQRLLSVSFCAGLLAAMYFIMNAAFSGGGDMDALKPFVEEHIICFVPMKPEGAAINIVHTTSPVHDLFYYIFHNPAHFTRLALLKLLSFFNLTRPYYSTAHNVALAGFIIPVYSLYLIGLRQLFSWNRDFVIYIAALLLLYPFGATFQCDDWHSRFTMVIFPYIILIACAGGLWIYNNRKSTGRSNP